jgi:NADH:ubiquinone oxidoreductase subunit F (NADH-binding)
VSEPRVSTSRLLEELSPADGWTSLADHRRRYQRPPAPGRRAEGTLIGEVERAGLTGRGGGGFPTAEKMRAVGSARDRPAVVVNGSEGEPASGKDRVLIGRMPHLVLDGALWAAAAVGADQVVVAVDRAHGEALAAVRRAAAERETELGPVSLRIAGPPHRYVAGESSALVHWITGGPAIPTMHRPHTKGVGGRPTLVQNAETVAHLAQIANRGAEWFRAVGTVEEPGTVLVTVSGAVARPSVIEVALGTPTGDIVDQAGGSTGRLQALLVGGFYGAWVPAPAALSSPFSRAGLLPLGAGPGAGVVIALPADACGLVETSRLLAWFAAEGAGQCGPCVFGLPALAGGTAALAAGQASADDVARLRRWAGDIDGRGACHHPDGAVGLLRSALDVFAEDVRRHAAGVPCAPALAAPVLRVPESAPGWR